MSDPFVDIMDPLRILRERIYEAAAGCGLEVVHVGIVPGSATEGPHEVQVLAILADSPPTNEDEEFERLLRSARDAELDQRAQQSHDELKSQLKDPGGFLE